MSGEFAFWHSVHRIVKQRWSSSGSGQSYVYRFDVNSDNNCFSTLNRVPASYREPIHMDDICHLFKTSFSPVPQINSVGWNTTQLMVGIFTRFAATGNPGIENWLPSTGANQRPPLYGYNIRETADSIGPLPEVRRMEVWDTFYYSASSHIKAFNLLLFFFVAIKVIV
jgi:Carboxylesterase family